MKKILFAITASLIMILAVTAAPTVNSNESDVDEYIVNTVEVKDQFQSYLDSINEKATKDVVYDKENCSYSFDTSFYDLYGQQELNDAPLTVTLNEEGAVSNYGSIILNDDGNISNNGTIISNDDSEIDDTVYSIIYDDNGIIDDIIITIEGQECSAREAYDPIDDCFVFILIPIVKYVVIAFLFFCLIKAVYEFYVDHHANTDEGTVFIDEEEDVVDGIKIGKKNGNIVAVSIWGQDYKVSDKNKLNDSNATREKENYHFALRYDGYIYVFPAIIAKSTAEKIMMMPYESLNKYGNFNVYTCYQNNAYSICTMFGEPLGPELHNNQGDYAGYYCHYHTNNHRTPAHSFFYW